MWMHLRISVHEDPRKRMHMRISNDGDPLMRANADANIRARRSADANADENIWNIDKYHELLINMICDSAVVTED